MKSFKLNDQANIPALGFGTWQIKGEEATTAVAHALEIGYRAIDTADRYENHKQVALGIKQSEIPREELFITTKIPPTHLHKQDILDSGKRFLEELQIEYIDLLLMHWPNKEIPIEESLEAFKELQDQGIIKAIGVSNFTLKHLEKALKVGVEITNNQVEIHPSFIQEELRKYCKEHNIVVTAYSTNGRGEDLKLPKILELAGKYDKTPYQIILNWVISQDMVAIPRSTKREHIEANFQCLDFELTHEDLAVIDSLNQDNRLSIPAWAEFEDS